MDPIAQMKVTTEKSWADLAEKEENLHQVNKKKKGSKSYKPDPLLSTGGGHTRRPPLMYH